MQRLRLILSVRPVPATAAAQLDRANNFNLLRLVLASAVLLTHSYTTVGAPEPLVQLVGLSMGGVAVDGFFVISGFLVTGSLLARQSAPLFFAARFLRIWPALTVSVLACAFIIGPVFTQLPLSTYLADAGTWRFVRDNLTLLTTGQIVNLPGVFGKEATNAPLWTLPFEVRMYLTLGLLWLIAQLAGPARQAGRVCAAILLLALFSLTWRFVLHFSHPSLLYGAAQRLELWFGPDTARFSFMFFGGAAFRVLAGRVTPAAPLFWVAVVALILAGRQGSDTFFAVYSLTLPYIVLYLSRAPAGPLSVWRRVGDYSFGTYIFAFPIQQVVAALVPGLTPWSMTAIAAPLTLAAAFASWTFIEEPSLRLKGAEARRPTTQATDRLSAP